MKCSYAQVKLEGDSADQIDVDTFLQATESMIKLFDLLGSSSFSVVKSDMTGNVAKIRTKFLENPAAHNTLQAIVLVEKDLGKKRVATEGLLWLMRGLQFTSQALRRNLDDPSEELSVSFQSAYGATLSKFHSFMIKPIFSLAMKACPYRADFYAKLAASPEEQENAMKQLAEWLEAFEKIVKILFDLYASGSYDKGL
ncbi:MAG: hypothetical protein SGCHY_001084 [Lobulomycetales sp.]